MVSWPVRRSDIKLGTHAWVRDSIWPGMGMAASTAQAGVKIKSLKAS